MFIVKRGLRVVWLISQCVRSLLVMTRFSHCVTRRKKENRKSKECLYPFPAVYTHSSAQESVSRFLSYFCSCLYPCSLQLFRSSRTKCGSGASLPDVRRQDVAQGIKTRQLLGTGSTLYPLPLLPFAPLVSSFRSIPFTLFPDSCQLKFGNSCPRFPSLSLAPYFPATVYPYQPAWHRNKR